jgi:hypothetical protein
MNRNTTIGLVLVLAALGLYVLLVQVPKDKAAANATGTPSSVAYLWTLSTDQVTGLRVVDRARTAEVALAKDAGGAWALTTPAGQVTDQAAASTVIGGLSTLIVDGTITSTTDLSAFGVLSPTYTIEVTLANGSKLKASVGDKSPTGTDYYVLREGETNVVTVGSFSIEQLTGLIDKPPIAAPPATETAGPGTGTPLASGTAATTVPGATGSPSASATEAATATVVKPTPSPTSAVTVTAAATRAATPTP